MALGSLLADGDRPFIGRHGAAHEQNCARIDPHDAQPSSCVAGAICRACACL